MLPALVRSSRRWRNPASLLAFCPRVHRQTFAALGVCTLLAPDEVLRYKRDGYIIPNFRLEVAELAAARKALDEILEANPKVMPELLVNAHLVDGEHDAEGVRGCQEFLMLASNPHLVNIVAQCLETENVILWACQIFCKLAGTGKSVPFHQDGMYWPIEPLRACSAWIALDRSDDECGALRVIPGSHIQGELEHQQIIDEDACITYIANPSVVESLIHNAKTLTLEPGEVSLHDSMLVHGSGRNASSRRRAGVAVTYMPAECHFNREQQTEGARKGGIKLDFSKRPLFVVKGSNQHSSNTLLRYV